MRFWTKIFGGSNSPSKGIKNESRTNFLSVLSDDEKASISNLNPLMYQEMIKEKQGEKIKVATLPGDNTATLLTKLNIEELQILSQSVQFAIQADSVSDQEALRLYKKAFELNPYNDLALMSYGCLLASQGNLREGIRWVEKAVATNPKSERTRRNLEGMRADLKRLQFST